MSPCSIAIFSFFLLFNEYPGMYFFNVYSLCISKLLIRVRVRLNLIVGLEWLDIKVFTISFKIPFLRKLDLIAGFSDNLINISV